MLSNNSRNRAGRRAAAAGSTSPLSHITCVTRAVHTHHFPGLASISINVRATMPTFHLPLACPGWRLLNLAQLYDSGRRLRDEALPTCLTCAKLKVWKLDDVKCPNTEIQHYNKRLSMQGLWTMLWYVRQKPSHSAVCFGNNRGNESGIIARNIFLVEKTNKKQEKERENCSRRKHWMSPSVCSASPRG